MSDARSQRVQAVQQKGLDNVLEGSRAGGRKVYQGVQCTASPAACLRAGPQPEQLLHGGAVAHPAADGGQSAGTTASCLSFAAEYCLAATAWQPAQAQFHQTSSRG